MIQISKKDSPYRAEVKIMGSLNQSEKNQTTSKVNIRQITITAVFAAVIFVLTRFTSIPVGVGNGYFHFGDMAILLAVAVVGWKYAPLAAGIGAMIADLTAGYAIWMVPTFIVKAVFALVCGIVAEKLFKGKLYGYVIGAVLGAIVHIIGYFLSWTLLFSFEAALSTLPLLSFQTAVGMVGGVILVTAVNTSGAAKSIRRLAKMH